MLWLLLGEEATRSVIDALLIRPFAIVAEESLIGKSFKIGQIGRSITFSMFGRKGDSRTAVRGRCREHTQLYYIGRQKFSSILDPNCLNFLTLRSIRSIYF